MNAPHSNPSVTGFRGSRKTNVSLAPISWFKVGGTADVLVKPDDENDLSTFLKDRDPAVPITIIGATSNIIIRDGGIRGDVIRLGRGFNECRMTPDGLYAGAFCLDMNVAEFAADHGIDGFAFLSGIPGTIGGGLMMNAGAYGHEFKDILIEAYAMDYNGQSLTLRVDELGMGYRHTNAAQIIFTGALFRADKKENSAAIKEKMMAVKNARASTQPIHERTGGSTFANPTAEECEKAGLPLMKSWQLIEGSGAHELKIGGAIMSPLHKNFMINTGTATAHDLESLGEAVRTHVLNHYGVLLRWEIKRLGEYLSSQHPIVGAD